MPYLVVTGSSLREIEAYLGFGSELMDVSDCKYGGLVGLVCCIDRYADWQSARFQSGMRGGSFIYTHEKNARTDYDAMLDPARPESAHSAE